MEEFLVIPASEKHKIEGKVYQSTTVNPILLLNGDGMLQTSFEDFLIAMRVVYVKRCVFESERIFLKLPLPMVAGANIEDLQGAMMQSEAYRAIAEDARRRAVRENESHLYSVRHSFGREKKAGNRFRLLALVLLAVGLFTLTLNAMLLIILITGIVFMAFNELEDACVRGRFKANFFNSNVSWINKWKYDGKKMFVYETKWYHFGVAARFEERFPYSSTLLAAATDGEHLFQALKVLTLAVGFWGATDVWGGVVFIVGAVVAGIYKESTFPHID